MSAFIGTYTRNIDDKQRLPLPRGFRDVLSDGGGVVTRLAGTLTLFTKERFEDTLARLELDVRAGERPMALLQGMAGNAYPVRPDAQNRIKLPREIMEEDELNGELVLLGSGPRVEIRPGPRHALVEAAADQALSADAEDYL
jgi:DNA-binding transcriptional regulator/RsmH inhibitor MraZ